MNPKETVTSEQQVLKFIEWFIPDHFRKDVTQHTRAQILVGVILANLILTLVFAVFTFFILDMPDYNKTIAAAIISECALLYSASLYTLRSRQSLVVAGNITTLTVFIAVALGVMITGGYTISPLVQLFVMVPVFVFLLVGLKSGISWSAFVLAWLVVLLILDNLGYTRFQVIDLEELRTLRDVLPLICMFVLIIALVIYETVNDKLKKQLHQERNRFAFKASHDPLTDLPNRDEFQGRLRAGIHECQQRNEKLALIYIDLDGFKPINDTLGHHAGDLVLVEIAKRLTEATRRSDTVARLGGDEFAVILPGIKTTENVEQVVRKILTAIAEPMTVDGDNVQVYGSAGIALYPEHSEQMDILVRMADAAMYQAKQTKNTFHFVQPETLQNLY